MTNPYPEGTGEHLLYAIFGEEPQDDDLCEDCGGRFVRGSHYCFGNPS